MAIASQCAACLGNLAELSDNQTIIAREGGVRPAIQTMRSRYVEVQREAGRLLANLCASPVYTDDIVKGGGHQLLISYLLSQDVACQRVGALGVGNLCTHSEHRVTVMSSGALEPLCSLARSEDVELEVQRYAVLAIANLACSADNHDSFVEEVSAPHYCAIIILCIM
jgi:Armadillo/beta-catenin-like repeat